MSRLLIFFAYVFVLSCSRESSETNEEIIPKTVHPVVRPGETENLRLLNLSTIPYALEEYKLKYRSYPVSSDRGSTWDGLYSENNEVRPDWVNALVPEFLHSLPMSAQLNDVGLEQYLYRSDGANYKLIALSRDGCIEAYKTFRYLVDPVRNCWAYGYWTAKAAKW